MTANETDVIVRFHHQDRAEAPFVAEDIRVRASVPVDAEGQPLYNAGATWVRLLQKAFAVFAGTHGQYGVAYRQPPRGGGYQGIAGGAEHDLYRVFYGPDVEEASSVDIAYAPGQAGRGAAVDLLNRLLAFGGREGPRLMLTAGASIPAHIDRALAEARTLGDGDLTPAIDEFVRTLRLVQQQLRDRDANVRQLDSVRRAKQQARTLVAELAGRPAVAALRELCLDIMNAGADSTAGDRFVYSDHAYAITSATIVMRAGVTPPRLVANDVANVDFERSLVRLRNPHRTNTPSGVQAVEDGVFDLTLEQFLRHFTTLDIGAVRRR